MLKRTQRRLRRARMGNRWLLAAGIAVAVSAAAAPAASAETATFSAKEIVPIPPASNYAGSAGGDGWAVALSATSVYNVFHHEEFLEVACHVQSNAEPCSGWPKEVTEKGTKFATPGKPEMYLDQKNGHLYVYATRMSDETAGVVCVNTTSKASDPLCGFTALTKKGEAPRIGYSDVGGAAIGHHGSETDFYAFNFVGGGQSGSKNKLMCFDVTKSAPCGGQPYAIPIPKEGIGNGSGPGAMAAPIGKEIVVSLRDNAGALWESCLNSDTHAKCSGTWPIKPPEGSGYGPPFPLLNSSGATTGFCVALKSMPCFNLSGKKVSTPAHLAEVVGETGYWAGPGVVIGPRIYLPNDNDNVECYSFSAHATCPGFSKKMQELGLLYTVNADPQRPTCLWVNADDGAHQIQSFEAYSGEQCGQGAVRVLAGQFVVNTPKCEPATYESIQIVKPPRSGYKSASVAFANGNGQSLGLPEVNVDNTGTASLTGLHLNSSTGLPQFLFTFNGLKVSGEVEVRLTWRADYSPNCVKPGMKIARPLRRAHIASTPSACIKASSYVASVSGSPIQSVTYRLNGRTVAVVRKANSHGQWTARIGLHPGVSSHLTAYVRYQPFVSVKSATLNRTLLRCAEPKNPAFTG